jgi:methanogenic corrinoid protein MtbC1
MSGLDDRTGALLMGIGAVSRATGIPVPTLRTWERRYGAPVATRTDGGHRLYDPETVAWLTQVARALEAGMRPKQALAAGPEELATALAGVERIPAQPPPVSGELDPSVGLSEWLAAAVSLDAARLDAQLRRDHAQLGTLAFLEQRVEPFLHAMGAWWAAGRMSVGQEHHASQRLMQFLLSLRRDVAPPAGAPVVVIAGLPGERHTLGAQIVSIALAVAGWRVVDLGADLPVRDVRAAVDQVAADALLISVSSTTDRRSARQDLFALREGLRPGVVRWLGGAGAPDDVPGWERPGTVSGLVERALALR